MKNYTLSHANLSALYVCLIFLSILSVHPVFAQSSEEINVSGKVMDAKTKQPMPGVNIAVKGTTTGTTTGADGRYSLYVSSPKDTLIFSFIGYQTRKIPINRLTTIDVQLTQKAFKGEEMVVVGYGTHKKKNIVGSIFIAMNLPRRLIIDICRII